MTGPRIPNSQPQGAEAYREIAERLNRNTQTTQPFYPYSVTSSVSVDLAYGVYLCDATAGAITVSLPPAAAYSGYQFDVKKTDATANAVTLTPSGSETIDGAATVSIVAQYVCLTVKSDGTGWHIV